jgi:hypothetical protein
MSYSAEVNKLYYLDMSGAFVEFEDDGDKPPVTTSSLSWVVGKREHLEFARIR